MNLGSTPRPFDAAAVAADADSAYRVFQARDARFDGRLFVGVTSTGVYCRPVCRVRTPRRENCRFFASAALAEAASFRPCLKCRPEIAPGWSLMDSPAVLADAAARRIEHAVHAGEAVSLPAIARQLGVTDRHLRRIFQTAHGVAPRDFVATQRLLLAKQLLTDTAEPVAQVALASGFDSVRRFNDAFASRYRLSPSRFRAEGRTPGHAALRLAWRPPYDVAAMRRFFARRALPGVEAVHDGRFCRTLALQHRGQAYTGWIAVDWDEPRHELRIEPSPSLAPALGRLIGLARRVLDLDADARAIDAVLADLPGAPGTRLPGAWDGFETAVRIVLGQQVSVAAATTLAARLVQALGTPVATPLPGLTHVFPDAAALAGADPEALGRLGIVRQRVRALQALAAAVADGRIALAREAPVDRTLQALQALPGIGPWTAQLIALRVLAWPDAFPASDLGVLQAMNTRDAAAAAARAEAWRPWRGYAVMRLWNQGGNDRDA